MKTRLFTLLAALLCATTIWAKPNLSGSGTKADPYLIGSFNDWKEFAFYVNMGDSEFDEYFKMTADIGPINSTDYLVGSVDMYGNFRSFQGIFDGDGHTLTMDFHSETFGGVAPFFSIYDATIKNLHVTGEITVGEPYAGGLVMEITSYYGNTIENCRVSTKIVCNATTSDDCMIGGIVASNPDRELNITGCVFDGQIIAPNFSGCAGFVGWNDAEYRGNVNITDCVFAPTALNVKGGKTFVRSSNYGEDYVTISNCYYDLGDLQSPLGDDQGKAAHSITGNEGVTVAMVGKATAYSMSQITAYSENAGLKYNDIIYAGSGDVVSLNLSGSGYAYTSSAGKLTGVNNPFTLTMEDADAVVSNSDIVIVSTDQELRTMIQIDGVKIQLANDIDLSNSTLSIESGKTVTIDLNGFTLDRKLTKRGEGGGQVITVREGATLNLSNGTLKGGWGGAGGALVNEGGMVTLTDVIITNNVADDRGGGICNREGGTLVMTGGVITDNSSNDHSGAKGGGGFFNEENATATLTGVTLTGNVAKVCGGGGICNFGTLTIDGCTITGNTAGTYGGGIWQEGTLNMQGANTISDNKCETINNNLYLKRGKVITVTGSLAGSSIGINMEQAGTFTSRYSTYNSGTDPATIFKDDLDGVMAVSLVDNEAQLGNALPEGSVYYVERSWDSENNQVVNTTKTLSRKIGYSDLPTAGDYKLVTNSNNDEDWFQLGGYSDDDEYYVVSGNVKNNTLNLWGKNVHLILLDGAKLTLATGILMYGDHNLYIHCQSYGSSMGKLIVQSGHDDNAAGIGSDGCEYEDTDIKYTKTPGNIEIHGGDIYSKGGYYGAGIGGGNFQNASNITIYGGKVEARGGGDGFWEAGTPGIGGGDHGGCGHITIYDGTVYAYGNEFGPGIGTGVKVETIGDNVPRGADNSGYNIRMSNTVDIYGGRVEAHGGPGGAGIGGGAESNGVVLTVNGGEVYAYGGDDAAGIGGGLADNGGFLTVNGGYVYAKGDGNGAGIGSGSERWLSSTVHGGLVVINGGEVHAYGGMDAAGIGGGEDADGGKVIITGGQVYAYGDGDAAGIGGGQDGGGGDVRIRGGYVYAEGKGDGAGIGGGEDGDGGYVSISDGTVVVMAGGDQRAIGAGYGSDSHGDLDFANNRCVYITQNLYRSQKANRVNDCRNNKYVRISECLHGNATASVVSGDKHNVTDCKWCYVTGEEPHAFGDDSQCNVCKLIRLADEGDNSTLFTKWADGDAHDFFLSGRKFETNSQIVNGEMVESSKAYTVCLPFDMDLSDRADDLTVWTLSYIKDGSEMVFTRVLDNKVEAGKPYLVVIHKGELELIGHSPLTVTPDEGVRVYDWDNREQPLGWWRGTMTKIESADAAEMMAYALQSVGDFRRIRPDTYWAWWGAFRSMYCPDELPGTNRFTINRGAFGGFGSTISFEGDADIDGEVVGISDAVRLNNNEQIINNNLYDLQGRKQNSQSSILNTQIKKGVYIYNGKKVIVK